MYRWSIIAAIFLLLTVVSSSVVASESEADDTTADCQLEMVLGGVSCVTDDGDELWRNEHPSLWPDSATYPEADEDVVVAARVATLDGRFVYTVNTDLLEVEPETGKVSRRTRFPGIITDLTTVDGGVELTVVHNVWSPGDDDGEIALWFELDGPDPAQASWSLEGFFWSFRDAQWLADEMEGEDDLVIAGEFEELYERDSTNPFYALWAGVAHRDAGDDPRAQEFFEKAANSTDAPWTDLFLLSMKLEEIDALEAAERAFERGVERMEDVGIESTRLGLSSEMAMVFSHYYDWGAEGPGVLPRAVEAGDVETVHRLSTRLAEVFPNVKEGHVVWRALAQWLDERDRPELADQWRERAEANLEARTGRFIPTEQFNRSFLAMLAFLLALAVVLFGLGARIGVAHYRRNEELDEPGKATGLPGFRRRDLVVPLLLVVAFVVTAVMTVDHFTKSVERVFVPPELHSDSLASPAVEYWLTEILAESPEQEELVSITRAEREALASGEPLPDKEPVFELVDDALEVHVDKGELPGLSAAGQGEGGFYQEILFMLLFGLLAIMVTCAVVVSIVVGRMFPGVGARIARFVPGGSPRFGPLAGLLAVGAIGALLVLTGMESLMRRYLVDELAYHIDYFGLGDMPPSDHYGLSRSAAWLTLAVSTAGYVAMVLFDTD